MLKFAVDAYRPLTITETSHIDDLREALTLRAKEFEKNQKNVGTLFYNTSLNNPGPSSLLIQRLLRALKTEQSNWPEPLDSEEEIENERIWFDIDWPDGDPLIDAILLSMKSEHSPLNETEIYKLCYRLAYLFASAKEWRYEIFRTMALKRREAATKGGKSGEVKTPHRWAWEFLAKNLEDVAYDSDGRRLSRYALSEQLHSEILHTEWCRQHSGARFAPGNCLPSAKTLRESPIWLKGMGLDALPEKRSSGNTPA